MPISNSYFFAELTHRGRDSIEVRLDVVVALTLVFEWRSVREMTFRLTPKASRVGATVRLHSWRSTNRAMRRCRDRVFRFLQVLFAIGQAAMLAAVERRQHLSSSQIVERDAGPVTIAKDAGEDWTRDGVGAGIPFPN